MTLPRLRVPWWKLATIMHMLALVRPFACSVSWRNSPVSEAIA